MVGMAVATIVASMAAMRVATMMEAMTKGRPAGVTVLTIWGVPSAVHRGPPLNPRAYQQRTSRKRDLRRRLKGGNGPLQGLGYAAFVITPHGARCCCEHGRRSIRHG